MSPWLPKCNEETGRCVAGRRPERTGVADLGGTYDYVSPYNCPESIERGGNCPTGCAPKCEEASVKACREGSCLNTSNPTHSDYDEGSICIYNHHCRDGLYCHKFGLQPQGQCRLITGGPGSPGTACETHADCTGQVPLSRSTGARCLRPPGTSFPKTCIF